MNVAQSCAKKNNPGLDKKRDFSLRIFLWKALRNPTHHNVKLKVSSLTNVDLRLIFYELYNIDVAKYNKLKVAVIYNSIKTIMSKWNGFYKLNCDLEFCYQQLVEYLKENLQYVNTVFSKNKSKYKIDEKQSSSDKKDTIEILCPFRKLKTIVNFDSIQVINVGHLPKHTITNTSSYPDLIRYISNLPHIEVKIACPSFVLSRQNTHRSEYSFVDLTKEYRPQLKDLDKRLKYSRTTKNAPESFPSTFILDFFAQFITAVQMENSFPTTKTTDLISILSEITMDIGKCAYQIDTNTDYYHYVNTFPYVRYLGVTKLSTKPVINFKPDQTKILQDFSNIRLQEVIYPCVKLNLSKFNFSYYKDSDMNNKFDFTSDFISTMMTKYIIIKCTLCHFERSGQMAKYVMEKHIYEEHGEEPNWFCYKCENEFSMRDLCAQRWLHVCFNQQGESTHSNNVYS